MLNNPFDVLESQLNDVIADRIGEHFMHHPMIRPPNMSPMPRPGASPLTVCGVWYERHERHDADKNGFLDKRSNQRFNSHSGSRIGIDIDECQFDGSPLPIQGDIFQRLANNATYEVIDVQPNGAATLRFTLSEIDGPYSFAD